ncbi:hypothetical protein C1T31_06080 [Hanstruepera neustonica]|uniref:DUF748 domain-containing protein n=1 Tax=Hanstruepera neustonica TaxID=1445657 RepID=A0A2K1E0U3_9FLAO|nr:DUF748 domain-containing protein [Hanstruepera neustonica]PNQ73893.1 hypothetical protein C1T31_06080 [Hanstruepera neustonica]
MSRRKKILIILFLTIVVLLFFLPTIIKGYIIKNSKELVGRQVAIEKLKYNYFTSTIKVYDFQMFEQNDKDIFTSFDTLIINLEPYKLISNTKALEQFYLQGLMVRTVMKDSTFNFDDLIAYHNTPKDSVSTENEETFKYMLSNLELKDANFFFDNQDINHITHIEDFSFFIPFIGWDQEEKSNADLKFNFKNGGYLESKLNIDPVSGDYDSDITINNLNLEPFYEYAAQYAEINTLRGNLNSKIKIVGNTNEAVKSIVSGHVDVHHFSMTDNQDKEFLKANRVDCSLKKIDYTNSSYELDSLNVYQPYVYFEMDSITNNFFQIFKIDQTEEPTPQGYQITEADSTSTINEDSNLYYAINNINIEEGVMDYSDNLTGERFDYHLSKIKMDSDGFSSNAEWVNMYSDMLLNERGTLNAKLGFNPLDYNNLKLDLVIENFLLSDINIYSQYYTGHSILVGDFYYYSSSVITNGNIESENNLLVKNVEVKNNKNGLFSLPLKFALFILKDKNGDVNLEIPVRGNLNDPEISIGKIVWTTFKRKITGAATNPVNSLAMLVDVDPKDYQELVFNYRDTIPSEEQFLKLDKLLEIESKKEGLKIELEHYVDKDLQKEAIALDQLGNMFYQETQKDYIKDEKDFAKYLKEKTQTDSLDIKKAVKQLLAPSTIDSLSIIINKKLLENTSNYLQTKNPETHISVFQSDGKEPDNKGSQSKFKIKFDMLNEEMTNEN